MLHLKKLPDGEMRKAVSALPKPRGDVLEQVLLLQKADLLASRYTGESLEIYDDFERRSRAVLDSGCPLDISDLEVKGEELAGLGVEPARRSEALKALLAEVLREPSSNRRPLLLEMLKPFQG
jgi:hypothetical protein